MSDLFWLHKAIKLKDLRDYEHNPRPISKKDFERLVESLEQDGYHTRIIVDTYNNNTIIGGHSRKKALLKAGYSPEDAVDILYPSRPLTPTEFKRLNIRDNLVFGAFDFDVLANHFNPVELIDWGLEPSSMNLGDVTFKEEKVVDASKQTCEMCGKSL